MILRRCNTILILAVLVTVCSTAVHAQMKVRVAPVIRAPITERIPLSGSVMSPRISDLAAQETGLVEAVEVEIGDRVEADQVLLSLDPSLAELELDRLKAMHEESELRYREAARLADEARSLIDDRNISQTEYNARLATEAAEQSRVKQLQAQIGAQHVRIQRHRIRAPFDGVISARHAEVGEWLMAGGVALQLVQTDPVRVAARVPERFFGDIRKGTPVEIRFDALPGAAIPTHVQSMVAATETDTRSFMAWVDIPNTGGRLAPGMSAHLSFLMAEEDKHALQVPADAIVRRSDGSAVIWVVREGVASAIPVALGRRNGEQVEVISQTLNEGDQAVTLGNESLQSGQAVAVE